jgi:molybdopterin molybdotransferase
MTSRRLIDDCFLTDGERLRHDEALAILRERVGAVAGVETVPLVEALGRFLAEPMIAPRNVPAADNAAVDGYAFAHADHAAAGGVFPVVARVAAGHPGRQDHLPGSAVRIFTGGIMPNGADTVAMQEDCETEVRDGREFVRVPAGLRPGANRRKAGEDLSTGALVAAAGNRLRPQDLAAIASIGRSEIPVYRRLRVAVVSTGDEIVAAGAALGEGQVYDSNRVMLAALLSASGCAAVEAGIWPDSEGPIEAALLRLAAECDCVLTTGGASRGEEDHLVSALDKVGRRHLWQLAVKPGRPMSFGQIGERPVVILPGNPVAAFVCFLLYVRPMLARLGGGEWSEPERIDVIADFELPSRKVGRREFLRGWLATDAHGRQVARKFVRDGSGLITSLRDASGLIEIPEEVAAIKRGDKVAFLPFSGFGILR